MNETMMRGKKMDLTNQRIRQSNRDMALILMIPTMILAKLIYLYVLPDKYYFDSWRMTSMLNEDGKFVAWEGYQTTVDFYRKINFFHLTNVNQWSLMLGPIMTLLIMYVVSKTKEMEMKECIFLLMSTGLLNIYVFNITKELIQMLFFLLILIIINLSINNTFLKIVGCAAVFYWESTFYRTYYIIMAVLTVFIYFLFNWLKNRRVIRKKEVFFTVALCFVAVFLFLYASQFISAEDYNEAISVRDSTANEMATTVISNPIPVNGNLGIFMFDYVINAVRMMFPLELMVKDVVYTPFVIYQFFILYYFIKTMVNLKRLDSNMVAVISCFSAYLLGSFIFEPDFGSWVRHESATFPILQMMAFRSNLYDSSMARQSREEIEVYETKNV